MREHPVVGALMEDGPRCPPVLIKQRTQLNGTTDPAVKFIPSPHSTPTVPPPSGHTVWGQEEPPGRPASHGAVRLLTKGRWHRAPAVCLPEWGTRSPPAPQHPCPGARGCGSARCPPRGMPVSPPVSPVPTSRWCSRVPPLLPAALPEGPCRGMAVPGGPRKQPAGPARGRKEGSSQETS